ncbi:MAG: hypothetical protein M8841_04145 [marine benthic group bacterium]|nr:hypothetical protein [Gemmatimonadota bacterium]MCL7976781.1 hypothetical protein [Gemmatimonadota bacterium]
MSSDPVSGEVSPESGSGDERDELRRVPVADRPNKVEPGDFAGPPLADGSFVEFFGSLPHILQAESLRKVAAGVVSAVERERTCLWMLGGHVVKTGLTPILIWLMERRAITHVAVNGSTVIHDYEMARFGGTSEDVEAGLTDGSFGMALETGRDMNLAIRAGHADGLGLGASLARSLVARDDLMYPELSILVAGHRLGVPITVHAAIGAEILHQHPEADGAAIGESSYRDFLALSRAMEGLDDGGAVLNVGSAVLLPEVFLKALTVRRNLARGRPRAFMTADFDMIRHYRPRVNVVERPTRTGGGSGYQITGHHEIMIPMLGWAIAAGLEGRI